MTDPKTGRLLSKDGSALITDEVYNTLISSLGAVLSVVGTLFLLHRAISVGLPWHLVGFSVYGLGLIGMFTASALHHGINASPETEHLLRQLDYYAIFVMIAGSFTPFCLILLRNRLGWFVLGLVWVITVVGIAIKALRPHAPRWFITSLYLAMGWLGVLIAKPIYEAIHWQGLAAMMLGGIFFTVGAVIYLLEKPNPSPGRFGFHEIWHCCVFAGAASHFYIMSCCL